MLDSAAQWTVAHQAPPSMGFSRQEYWSGLPTTHSNRSAPLNQFLVFDKKNFFSPSTQNSWPASGRFHLRLSNLSKLHLSLLLPMSSVCARVCSDGLSCPTLCNPTDYAPPGSSIHGISQARILEWVVISFSRGSSQTRDQTQVSHIAGQFFTL